MEATLESATDVLCALVSATDVLYALVSATDVIRALVWPPPKHGSLT
jgi:hypothetical protein